jgi:hypothetical protein
MTAQISRAAGLATASSDRRAGSGHPSESCALAHLIEDAAAALTRAYRQDVEIRFSADGRHAAAFLVTDRPGQLDGNADIGICAEQADATRINLFAHVSGRALRYRAVADTERGGPNAHAHTPVPSINDALAFLLANAIAPGSAT